MPPRRVTRSSSTKSQSKSKTVTPSKPSAVAVSAIPKKSSTKKKASTKRGRIKKQQIKEDEKEKEEQQQQEKEEEEEEEEEQKEEEEQVPCKRPRRAQASTSLSTAMYGMSSVEAGLAMYEAVREILKKYPHYRPPTTKQQQVQQQKLQKQQKKTLNHIMSADVASLCTSYLDELNEMMKQVITKMTAAGYDVSEQSRELLQQHLMWSKAEKKQAEDSSSEEEDYGSYGGMFSSAGEDALEHSTSEVCALYPAGYTSQQVELICQQIADRCDDLGHGEAGDTAVRDPLWESLSDNAVDRN